MLKCKSCGKENGDNLWKCEFCNFPLHEENKPQDVKPKPKNYMVISVLLLLSCIPTAIVSFIYGLKVNSSFLNGNYAEAETYTEKAKLWLWISVGLGIVIMLVFLVYAAEFYNKMAPGMEKEMQNILGE